MKLQENENFSKHFALMFIESFAVKVEALMGVKKIIISTQKPSKNEIFRLFEKTTQKIGRFHLKN